MKALSALVRLRLEMGESYRLEGTSLVLDDGRRIPAHTALEEAVAEALAEGAPEEVVELLRREILELWRWGA